MADLARFGVPWVVFIAGFALWQGAAHSAVAQTADPLALQLLAPDESSLRWQEPRGPAKPAERPASRAIPTLRVGAELWFAEIHGNLESNVSGFTDTKFSISSDAGVESEIIPKVFIDYAPNDDFLLRLGLRLLDTSGSHTLTETIVFDGKTFPTGSRVSSDFEAFWLSLDARFPARVDPKDPFQGQGVVSLYVLDATFELSGDSGKGRQHYSIEFLETGLELKAMIVEGAFLGGNVNVAWGFLDSFIGGEFTLKGGYLSKRVTVEAGFRWWAMGGAINDEPDLDLRLKGPFLSAIFRF